MPPEALEHRDQVSRPKTFFESPHDIALKSRDVDGGALLHFPSTYRFTTGSSNRFLSAKNAPFRARFVHRHRERDGSAVADLPAMVAPFNAPSARSAKSRLIPMNVCR